MSALTLGNAAARAGDSDTARRHYADVLVEQPALAEVVFANLLRLAPQADRSPELRVTVAGFELGHNAAGRAAVLAQLHARAGASVEIVGPVMAPYQELWLPLQDFEIPHRVFSLPSPAGFLRHMIPLVAAQRADVVYLSKARGPNLLTAALYKLFWNSVVLIDVDDEELGFVGATESLSFEQWQQLPESSRSMSELVGREWTCLATGLTASFDGITVANGALQERYGGLVIPHARDERHLTPSASSSSMQGGIARARFGVPPHARVVLFFGTPRAHKGLMEVARTLASLNDPRWQLVIVGDFEDHPLQRELESLRSGLVHCIPGQPFAAIPEILSMADVCILLQQGRSQAVRFQTPAKLTDALAMQVPVLASNTEGMREFIRHGAVRVTTPETLATDLHALFDAPDADFQRQSLVDRGRRLFEEKLSFASNSSALIQSIEHARAEAVSGPAVLGWEPVQVLQGALLSRAARR